MAKRTSPDAPPQKQFQGFRKIYHVLNSSMIPLYYWYNPFHVSPETLREHVLIISGVGFVLFFLFDLFRLRVREFNNMVMKVFSFLIRKTEEKRFTGSTFLCLSFFLVALLFDRPVAIASMLFLSLGDAAAELVGRRFGRHRIFNKSWEGTFAFFLVSFPLAWALVDDWRAAVLGAAIGALVELFSFDVDDNLTVPIGSAVALWSALRWLPPLPI